ncbi:hypothetical protein [Rhodococcus erythropolis]
MDALCPCDTLVVWRLVRLGRSLPHLITLDRGGHRTRGARGVGGMGLADHRR